MKSFFSLFIILFFSQAVSASDFDIQKQKAENGDIQAQFDVATRFDFGDDDNGVTQDYEKAIYWYEQAAQQGHSGAQVGLGTMYFIGKGVEQSFSMTALWYEKAAMSGNAYAQSALGKLYFLGKGVPKDKVKAYVWSSLATLSGDEEAEKFKNKMSKKMTKEELTSADLELEALKPKVRNL